MLALAKELPELRFVFLAQRDFSDCMATLAGLSEQPFRFLAFLDDLSLSEREYRRLKAAVKSRLYGGNSLLYATADQRPRDSSVFGLELGLKCSRRRTCPRRAEGARPRERRCGPKRRAGSLPPVGGRAGRTEPAGRAPAGRGAAARRKR